jgi:hypothetical protein
MKQLTMKRTIELSGAQVGELLGCRFRLTLNQDGIWGYEPFALQLLDMTGARLSDRPERWKVDFDFEFGPGLSHLPPDMYTAADWSLIQPSILVPRISQLG